MGLFKRATPNTPPAEKPEVKPIPQGDAPNKPGAPATTPSAATPAASRPPSVPATPAPPPTSTPKTVQVNLKPQEKPVVDERAKKFQELKGTIHRKLVEQLDMTKLGEANAELRENVRQVVVALCEEENTLLNHAERTRLSEEILDETFGLGPLEALLKDPRISDILINGPHQVYIERGGRLELSEVKFKDNGHLLHIIDKIVAPLGRRCDEVSPMVDARLKDGSRVNAIIPPLAIDGASMSIRRFGKSPVTWDNYVAWKSCSEEMVEFFRACVKTGLNVLVAGGTGSGKTTLLNNLSSFIPTTSASTIEDAAELQMRQPHVVRLERPPNLEGKAASRSAIC